MSPDGSVRPPCFRRAFSTRDIIVFVFLGNFSWLGKSDFAKAVSVFVPAVPDASAGAVTTLTSRLSLSIVVIVGPPNYRFSGY